MKLVQVLLNAQAHHQSTHEKISPASGMPGGIKRITQMLDVRDMLQTNSSLIKEGLIYMVLLILMTAKTHGHSYPKTKKRLLDTTVAGSINR